MKKSLIYIPSGLNSPEIEILLCQAQKEIDEKKKVYVLICDGGKNNHCSKNVYSIKSICFACKNKRDKYLNLLKGKFTLISIPFIKKSNHLKKDNFKFPNVFDYTYKKVDNGLASYSSYVGLTRDRDLDGNTSNITIGKLINTSNQLTLFFLKLLKKEKFSDIYLYNGRNNNYRPLLRVANLLKQNVHNLEFKGDENQVFDFQNHLPIDRRYIAKRMNTFWKKTKKKNLKLIDKHIKIWEIKQTEKHKSEFKVKQELNFLPIRWNKNKKNIVFFCNSEDESLTGGKEYFYRIFNSQAQAILTIYKMIKKKDDFKNINFWVRMHPRMNGLKWPHLKSILSLVGKYNNLNIILPDSNVSSYAMLKKSDVIISPTSTLAIEGVYYSKPVICIQHQPFTELKGGYLPKTLSTFEKLIFKKKLKPRSKIAQMKYHYFELAGGFKFKSLKGDFYENPYRFKNKVVELSFVVKFIYLFGKILEKYFYVNTLNYFPFKLKEYLNEIKNKF